MYSRVLREVFLKYRRNNHIEISKLAGFITNDESFENTKSEQAIFF